MLASLSSCVYSFPLPLPLDFVFGLAFGRAGDLALLTGLDFARDAALLGRGFTEGTAPAVFAVSTPPASLLASPGRAPSGPSDLPRCSAVSCDSSRRSCRKTS